ncbi:MAG: CARDB domain-containing protein [Ferruginibacter sp.]
MKSTIIKFFFCIFFTGLCRYVAAQPDLSLANASCSQSSFARGNNLNLSYQINNIGNLVSANCHTTIYLSTSTSITSSSIRVSDVSCESIAAGGVGQLTRFAFPIPYNVPNGNNYIILSIDSRSEVAESNESNNISYIPTAINISSTNGAQQNLPYPVILVHGLNSSQTTWNTLLTDMQNRYGWSYGGNMNFCLNQDGNLAVSLLSTDYKDWSGALTAGDIYTVNFNVALNGTNATLSNDVESNQSAVDKQGVAIRDAIKHVLQITGRSKVILAGHSMGGLASREYLQNPSLWQTDGMHHVAKLLTIGTPHGGSNFGFGYAEAIRDLRSSYAISGSPGVYLFGGVESYSVMKDNASTNFNNVDVNCNGVDADGSLIIGLNQKILPSEPGYTCIIGTYLSSTSDGVVTTASANLNNYYSSVADTLMVNSSHTSETAKIPVIISGLHEPYTSARALDVNYNNYYFGNISTPGIATGLTTDSNYYKLTVAQNSYLSFEVFNIPVFNAGIKVYNAANTVMYAAPTAGKGYINSGNISLNAGTYYINFYGVPDTGSLRHPYALKSSFAPGICPSSGLIIPSDINGSSYQWQEDTGNGFTDISPGAHYANATTAQLQLLSPPTDWYGNKYRCRVNGSLYSAVTILKFATSWTGITRDWENAANWSCGYVPDANTDVYVNPGVPFSPQVNVSQSCRSLITAPTTIVIIQTGAVLSILGK